MNRHYIPSVSDLPPVTPLPSHCTHLGCHRVLSSAPCALQQLPTSYLTRGNLYTWISISQFIPPSLSLSVPTCVFSTSEFLFLPWKWIHLYHLSRFNIWFFFLFRVVYFWAHEIRKETKSFVEQRKRKKSLGKERPVLRCIDFLPLWFPQSSHLYRTDWNNGLQLPSIAYNILHMYYSIQSHLNSDSTLQILLSNHGFQDIYCSPFKTQK